MNSKYQPLLFVCFFAILGLFISVLLRTLNCFLEGYPIFEGMEAHVFIAVVSIAIGFVYCEIRTRIGNHLMGAFVFGVLSPMIFFIGLEIQSFRLDWGNNGIDFDFYIVVGLVVGVLMSMLYVSLERK